MGTYYETLLGVLTLCGIYSRKKEAKFLGQCVSVCLCHITDLLEQESVCYCILKIHVTNRVDLIRMHFH